MRMLCRSVRLGMYRNSRACVRERRPRPRCGEPTRKDTSSPGGCCAARGSAKSAATADGPPPRLSNAIAVEPGRD
jgi:hypothetical protein